MQELIQYLKKEEESKLTEFQWDVIDYVRAVIGTIHLTLATKTGSLTLGLI
ncbi:hypothetical protein KAR91_06985 [Candidatus Pacearchaeota archaeon]|nr:hypothetical protein [Candidatus Pacearchaeota archaeon]